jgi:hypothetical protein
MKMLLFFSILLWAFVANSQVGIGTTAPNAQLDIRSSSQTSPAAIDGILIPKVDNFPVSIPTASQDGMLVFATGLGTPAKGFYYWNQTITNWTAVGDVKKIDDLLDGKSDSSGSSIFLGLGAGETEVSTTNRNIGVGFNSLNRNNTGTNNTALGYQTLLNNESGNSNTAIGSQSLRANTTVLGNSGQYNTATGSQSLKWNTLGSYNTANGFSALTDNVDGEFNTAMGYQTLYGNIGGDYNTAIGNQALFNLTGGNENTVIGKSAGFNLTTATGNVFIGANSGGVETTNGNLLYIENSSSTSPLIGGDFATDRVGINRPIALLTNTLEVGGEASKASAGDWLANSDRRLKKNIQKLEGSSALEKISKLNGVSYEWNDTQTGIQRPKGIQYGFIAQELMEVFPENVKLDKQGFYQTAYGTYDAFYVQAIKELKNQLDEKEKRIQELEEKVSQLTIQNTEQSQIQSLENRLKNLELFLGNQSISKD